MNTVHSQAMICVGSDTPGSLRDPTLANRFSPAILVLMAKRDYYAMPLFEGSEGRVRNFLAEKRLVPGEKTGSPLNNPI
jgi:hypothetical protein